MIKGFLRVCTGIIGGNVLTFQDTEITKAKPLRELIYSPMQSNTHLIVPSTRQVIVDGIFEIDGIKEIELQAKMVHI